MNIENKRINIKTKHNPLAGGEVENTLTAPQGKE